MRRFAEWLENNPNSDLPSPTKRHKKEKREASRALVIIFENLEAFDRQVVDEVVLVLGSYAHVLRFVIIFGVATEARVVHSLLSHDSYKLLALRTFRFPSPAVFLHQVIDSTVFNDKIWFKFHPKMVQLFVGRYEQENFSIAELSKSMKLALLDHFLTQPASALCCQEPIAQQRFGNYNILSSIRALDSVKKANIISAGPASQIARQLYEPLSELFVYVRCYKPVLSVLFWLFQDLPDSCFAQISQDIVHLHHAVMSSSDFFNAKLDHFYGKATALWACWTVEEWKEKLGECVRILNSADQEALPDLIDVVQDLDRFIENLTNVDERQRQADAEVIGEQHEKYVGKSPSAAEAKKRMAEKLSFFEMQRKIQLRRVVAAKSNVFQRDKKEIGEYLTKTFKMYLRSPDSVPMHECLFPTLTDSFRSRSMAAPNKCLDQTLLCPE
uniref:Origin recognition complex subunit 3 n=2 Tax=Plectus sambesii TaxID=2011161 RepID=A0A914UZB0_9BILA